MTCQYCGFAQPMPVHAARGAVQEIPIEEGYRLAARGLGVAVTTLSCKDCGATVNVAQGERTADCAFCGSKQVLQVETDANAIRPESLVAFQIDKANANQRFGDWLKGLWFRPSDLKRIAKVNEMGGVYVRSGPSMRTSTAIGPQRPATIITRRGVHDGRGRREPSRARGRCSTRAGNRRGEAATTSTTTSSSARRRVCRPSWSRSSRPSIRSNWCLCAAVSRGLARPRRTRRSAERTRQGTRQDDEVAGSQLRARRARRHAPLSERQQPLYQETFKHVLLPIWIAAYRYNNKVFRSW